MAMVETGQVERKPRETQTEISDDPEPTLPSGNSKIASSIFNLANTIVGSGVLTIPYDLQCTGYGLGLFGLLFVAACSLYSFYMLSFASKRTGLFSYRDIGESLFGHRAGFLVELLVVIYTTGTCCAYPIIMRDNMFWWNTKDSDERWYTVYCMWAIVVVVVFPLALLPKMDFLRFTSLAALISVAYIVVVIIIFYFEVQVTGSITLDPPPAEPVVINSDITSVFTAFPLLGVAFTAHYNCLNVYAELKDRTLARMNKVIGGTGTIIIIVYTAMGIFGYLTFTDQTEDDILKNFSDLPNAPVYTQIANACMLVTIIFSFPMVSFALRRSLLSLIFSSRRAPLAAMDGDEPELDEVGELLPHPSAAIARRDRRRRVIFTIIIVGVASTIATFVNSISAVLSFTSSIAGTSIVYIFPGLFYHRLLRPEKRVQRVLAIAMVCVGFFFMVTGLGSAVYTRILHPE
eukprot:gnl/Chilomastix_cuspidata/501.p2 GENE.gnl/Chilomastix_cuspidata/501~~gnl/Chilomastix_cuspidata/501.p2  ORF type:complete len:461 (+),score=183.87 gnl/Chilomastix_cuspidata/501:3034-4416(+)